jgi:hypothetical protein
VAVIEIEVCETEASLPFDENPMDLYRWVLFVSIQTGKQVAK